MRNYKKEICRRTEYWNEENTEPNLQWRSFSEGTKWWTRVHREGIVRSKGRKGDEIKEVSWVEMDTKRTYSRINKNKQQTETSIRSITVPTDVEILYPYTDLDIARIHEYIML